MRLASRVAIFITVVFALAAFTTDSVVVAKESKKSTKQTVAKSKKIDPEMIMAVQKALVEEGYKLKVDGKLGRQVRSALRKFQKKNRLKVTGRINKATLEKMRIPSPSGA